MNRYRETHDGVGTLTSSSHTLYTIFLPIRFNDGRRIQPMRLVQAQQDITTYARGLTCFFPALGFWVGPGGRMYQDELIPFQIVLPSSPQNLVWVTRQASELTVAFDQLCLFVTAQPVVLVGTVPAIKTVERVGPELTEVR